MPDATINTARRARCFSSITPDACVLATFAAVLLRR
jgi:hypothetical protein